MLSVKEVRFITLLVKDRLTVTELLFCAQRSEKALFPACSDVSFFHKILSDSL